MVKTINLVLVWLIQMPIWWYLIYVMLSAAHPDRLVWFLFYIYMPVSLLTTILSLHIAMQQFKEGKK